VDVVPEWRLEELAAKYPLLVVPEWKNIGTKVRDLLLGYARNGGKLLVTGAHPAAMFADALDVKLVGEPFDQAAFVTGDELFGSLHGLWRNVDPGSANAIESRYPTFDASRDGQCAATLSSYGKGQIAAIYGPVGGCYKFSHAASTRQFLRRVVARIFAPVVEVSGANAVEVVVRRKNRRLLVHLINGEGLISSSEFQSSGYIPPVGPLRLRVKLPAAPSRVTVEPGARPLAGTWSKGVWQGTLPKLAIHEIVSFAV
jgi:hypothetical protein